MEGNALDIVTALSSMNNGKEGGMDGSWGIWILVILFFIMGAGGNGIGLGGGSSNSTLNTLTNEFLYTNLNSTLDRGFMQVANQNMAIQQELCVGLSGVNSNIAESRFAAQQCCCETNRNIDAIRYENAKNTCDIVTAANENTQRIIDLITQNEVQALRDKISGLELGATIQNGNQYVINQVRPMPIPAWPVQSPYTSNCGCYTPC